MKYTVAKQQEFIDKKLKDFVDNMKWNWREMREGNLIHHYGNLVGTIEEIHYCTDGGVVLDIYLYCNVCGEKAHTKDIGIVFGSHTCTTCADNMGEKCHELGTQHI